MHSPIRHPDQGHTLPTKVTGTRLIPGLDVPNVAGGHFPLTGGHGFVGRQQKEQRDVGPGTHLAEYLQIHHQTGQEKKMHQEATPSLALSLILPVTDFEDTPGEYKPGLLSLPFPTTSRHYTHAPTVHGRHPSVGTLTPYVTLSYFLAPGCLGFAICRAKL